MYILSNVRERRLAMKTKILILLFSVLFSSAAAAQQKNSYSIGFLMTAGYSDPNFKKIITDALNSVSKEGNVKIDLRWFTEENEFMAAVKNGELDIVYPFKNDVLPSLIGDLGYNAFMALTIFAKKGDPQNPLCLFAARDLKVTKTDDLRGRRLASYYTAEGYVFMRKMLGSKPEAFFSEIIPNKKGQEALDQVLAGRADAAFVLRSNILALQKIKTTEAKKIDTIACAKDFYDLPFLYRKDVPVDLVKRISDLLENADRNEIFKPFWPMMKNFGLRFLPISTDKYKPMLAVYAEAKEKGWLDDYRKWLASVEK